MLYVTGYKGLLGKLKWELILFKKVKYEWISVSWMWIVSEYLTDDVVDLQSWSYTLINDWKYGWFCGYGNLEYPTFLEVSSRSQALTSPSLCRSTVLFSILLNWEESIHACWSVETIIGWLHALDRYRNDGNGSYFVGGIIQLSGPKSKSVPPAEVPGRKIVQGVSNLYCYRSDGPVP